jgi:kanamycin kinase
MPTPAPDPDPDPGPASRPAPDPPPELAQVAPGWAAEPAHRSGSGTTTWRLTGPGGSVRFAKVDTGAASPTLRAESERMIWAVAYLPVPRVVALEELGPTTVLLTEALPGHDATHPVWRDDLPALVRALGRGLRRFHQAVGEEWCPFRFDVERALDHVRGRVAAGQVDPGEFHPNHAHLRTAAEALVELEATAPDAEDLVVCHGDYCAPNMLLQRGRVTGYVDLGELGAADRWWDVAVGAWSVGWNFGEEHEPLFFEGYGVEPDPGRIRFYRLLYDLVS